MGLPLPPGHVLVRLWDTTGEGADTVLDGLEGCLPNHTGRGRNRIGNAWEDPPSVTAEGTWAVARPEHGDWVTPADGPAVVTSQAFDVAGPRAPGAPPGLDGVVGAELYGAPKDVDTMLGVLGGLFTTEERAREAVGPLVRTRLSIGERTAAEPGDER